MQKDPPPPPTQPKLHLLTTSLQRNRLKPGYDNITDMTSIRMGLIAEENWMVLLNSLLETCTANQACDLFLKLNALHYYGPEESGGEVTCGLVDGEKRNSISNFPTSMFGRFNRSPWTGISKPMMREWIGVHISLNKFLKRVLRLRWQFVLVSTSFVHQILLSLVRP